MIASQVQACQEIPSVDEAVETVKSIAGRFCRLKQCDTMYDDLVQEGCLSYHEHAPKYDASRGVKFWSYVGECIWGAMQHFYDTNVRITKKTMHYRQVHYERAVAMGVPHVEALKQCELTEDTLVACRRVCLPMPDNAHELYAYTDDRAFEELLHELPAPDRDFMRFRYQGECNFQELADLGYGNSRQFTIKRHERILNKLRWMHCQD